MAQNQVLRLTYLKLFVRNARYGGYQISLGGQSPIQDRFISSCPDILVWSTNRTKGSKPRAIHPDLVAMGGLLPKLAVVGQ